MVIGVYPYCVLVFSIFYKENFVIEVYRGDFVLYNSRFLAEVFWLAALVSVFFADVVGGSSALVGVIFWWLSC